jgi:hypothetical protein
MLKTIVGSAHKPAAELLIAQPHKRRGRVSQLDSPDESKMFPKYASHSGAGPLPLPPDRREPHPFLKSIRPSAEPTAEPGKRQLKSPHYSIEYTFADGTKLFMNSRYMSGCREEFPSYAHVRRRGAKRVATD